MKQTTFILDASSLFYRAFHAAKERPTYTKDGAPNYAVNLLRKMLEKLRRDYKPDYMVAACDCKEPTFRTKLYPAYKAQRLTPPEEYLQQLPGMRDVLRAFHIPEFEMAGYEADDIIGTLTQHIEGDVVIVTGDKDMAQLVEWSGRVTVLNTHKNKMLDSAGVTEEYGVPPSQITDLLALTGDASDNVPGAKGIGQAGAVCLLKHFCSVEEIISRAGEISLARYRHAVLCYANEILLSKKLVTIVCDVPLWPESAKQEPPARQPSAILA
jgi:DNA polymerase-1